MVIYCYNINGLMSQWTNTAFMRIWRVGNKYYGINQSGVFELTGNTDNGTAFVSRAVTNRNDLGKFNLKRLPSARVNANGKGTIKAMLDNDTSTGSIEFTQSERVKFGRGAKGRHLSLDIQSSTEGFEVQSIELFEQVLSKGVK